MTAPGLPLPLCPEQVTYVALSPIRARKFLRAAYEGTATPRRAIWAKCTDCKQDNRVAIRFCDSFLCPLHLYRPFQIEQKSPNQST